MVNNMLQCARHCPVDLILTLQMLMNEEFFLIYYKETDSKSYSYYYRKHYELNYTVKAILVEATMILLSIAHGVSFLFKPNISPILQRGMEAWPRQISMTRKN